MTTKLNKAERQARLTKGDAVPTRDALYKQAKELGLTVKSTFTKAQLLDAITAHGEEATPDVTTMQGRQELGDQRVSEAAQHYLDMLADPDAPKAEEEPAKRTIKAKAEQAALKEWQLAGKQGERPATPNYDFIAATYLGTAPRSSRRASGPRGGSSRVKSGGPRRAAADAEKAVLGGKRGKGTKISDDDLRAYIAQAHATHPNSSRSDEREYAYWVEKLSLTGRWPKFWSEVVGGATPAPSAPVADDDAEGEDPDAIAAALDGHAKVGETIDGERMIRESNERMTAAAAKRATKAPAKPTGAKRGDNLRSKSKDVTPIPKGQPKPKRPRKATT